MEVYTPVNGFFSTSLCGRLLLGVLDFMDFAAGLFFSEYTVYAAVALGYILGVELLTFTRVSSGSASIRSTWTLRNYCMTTE